MTLKLNKNLKILAFVLHFCQFGLIGTQNLVIGEVLITCFNFKKKIRHLFYLNKHQKMLQKT